MSLSKVEVAVISAFSMSVKHFPDVEQHTIYSVLMPTGPLRHSLHPKTMNQSGPYAFDIEADREMEMSSSISSNDWALDIDADNAVRSSPQVHSR